MQTFGMRLRSLREEKEITQEELGKLFSVTKTAISLYESDKRFPDQDTLIKLAAFFNVSVDYLLGVSDEKGPFSASDAENAYTKLDASGLPEEAIKQIEDYIQLLKLRYNPGGHTKKQD